MSEIIEGGKFIAGLSLRGWINILAALILLGLGYTIYDQKQTINARDNTILSNSRRCTYNDSIMQSRLERSENLRREDMEKANNYWRGRVDTLEAKAERNYQKIKETR